MDSLALIQWDKTLAQRHSGNRSKLGAEGAALVSDSILPCKNTGAFCSREVDQKPRQGLGQAAAESFDNSRKRCPSVGHNTRACIQIPAKVNWMGFYNDNFLWEKDLQNGR